MHRIPHGKSDNKSREGTRPVVFVQHCLLDCKTYFTRNNLDTTLTVQDLKDWERKNGKIPRHAVSLLYTGQSKFYDDENKFFGREEGFSYPDTDSFSWI